MAEFLLEIGYEVADLARRHADGSLGKLDISPARECVKIFHGDLMDPNSVEDALRRFRPHEIYNLVAQSSPLLSFQIPDLTMSSTGIGAVTLFKKA